MVPINDELEPEDNDVRSVPLRTPIKEGVRLPVSLCR